VFETPGDIEELQGRLDLSYASAGPHLLRVHDAERRVGAATLCGLLLGTCILTLATVTGRGEPVVAPIDGHFYRGHFYCAGTRDAIRTHHIRERPAVSISYLRASLGVTVHGRAQEVDRQVERSQGYRTMLVGINGQELTDQEWDGDDIVYWEILPRRMFAVAFPS
jgi:hypothetical protein